MRHPLAMTGVIAALILAGCQAPAVVGANPPAGNAPGTTVGVQPQPGPASASKLGAYTFVALSGDAAAALSSRAANASGGARTAAAPMAPEAAGASTAMAADAKLVAPGSPYYHGSYFAGPYGPMKMESATEAKGPGITGGWADVKAQVIQPVLADWGTDGRLIATSGTLDVQGNPIASGEERWPGELGWHATYASASKNEVLEFHVLAGGTTITKLRWAPINLDLDAAAVDAKAAVVAVTTAIKDQAAKSEEDKLGRDYFFGTDMGMGGGMNGVAVAVAPVPPEARTMPAPDIAILPVAPGTPLPSPKPIYELGDKGRWRASLQAINDKVVWEVNYDPITWPEQKPGDDWWLDPSAYGMVDAKSGVLVRFKRPQMNAAWKPEPGVPAPGKPEPASDLAAQ